MARMFVALLLLALCAPDTARAQALSVLYFERPPYYFTQDGRPAGMLVTLAREILEDAGVEHAFQEMPPKRIIETIKSSTRPACSIGWFITPEREAFATFSLPIYQDLPLHALFMKTGRPPSQETTTFAALAENPHLVLGLNASFSYGPAVDAIRQRLAAHPVLVNAGQEQLMRMLAAGRFDYMLVNPEEVDTLAGLAGIDPDDLAMVALSDVPAGNSRYLMFSKTTPADIVVRVNQAIRRIHGGG